MKRIAVILVVLLVAIVASLWLWRGLDADVVTSGPNARGAADASAADEHSVSTATLQSVGSRDRAEDDKESSAVTPREAVATPPAEVEDIALHGLLYDAIKTRQYIAGANVELARATERIVLKTDVDGQFELKSLMPGNWMISIDAPGYRTWSKPWYFAKEPRFQKFRVPLERHTVAWVAARTTDGSEFFVSAKDMSEAVKTDPLAQYRGALALITTDAAPGDRLVPGADGLRRSPLGEVRTDGGPGGAVMLKADGYVEFAKAPPLFVSACAGDLVLDTQYVKPGQELVMFTIPLQLLRRAMHEVRMRVLDADSGTALTSARVSLMPDAAWSPAGRTTDAGGWVQFETQASGTLQLTIRAPDHEWFQAQVNVAETGDTDLGTYRLAAATWIEGRCVSDDGRTQNLILSAVELDGEQNGRVGTFMQRGSSGQFKIDQLGRHRYLVRVHDEHWSAKPIVVDTTHGSKTGIEIRCVPGATVVLDVDAALVDEIRVFDVEQLAIAESSVPRDGKVELHLFPGAYAATLVKTGRSISTTSFQAGGEAQVIHLRGP
jgi:hypothetical protein